MNLTALVLISTMAAAPAALEPLPELREYRAQREAGAVVLVTKRGRTLLKGGFGVADAQRQRSLGASTVFYAASLAKAMTAFAVAQLVVEKRLRLDDPVKALVPSVPYGDVTLRQLIAHTAGIPRETPADCADGRTTRDLVDDMASKALPRAFPAGDAVEYTNRAYAVVALAIEGAVGKSFPRYMTDRYLAPIGMANAYIRGDGGRPPIDAAVPMFAPAKEVKPILCGETYGLGGLYASLEDLEKWTAFLSRTLDARLKQLVFDSRERTKGGFWSMSFGWTQAFHDGKPYYQSAGEVPGMSHLVTYVPDGDIWIVQLSNRDDYPKYAHAHELLRGALAAPH